MTDKPPGGGRPIEYSLYLESGPRRQKTMVHVLDLLGCIAQGPTTEAALEATPGAIRAYLSFLQGHDEQVEPDAAFSTVVVEHVMEGPWLGNGNPAPGFGPDFQTLGAEEQAVYLRRLAWLQAGLLQLIEGLPAEQLAAEPQTRGRSIYRILEHVAESQYAYLRAVLGTVDGLPAALRAVRQGPEGVASALRDVWGLTSARLEAMTGAERAKVVQRGQVTWMARRMLRRLLEHNWEHLLEISERLAEPPG
ncbi:DinB family protein [Chloroflexota bacterium]